MSNNDGKDPTRVAAGLKAATHNPNVSEEAKQSAQERLEEMDAGGQERGRGRAHAGNTDNASGTDHNRAMGGYKATMKNPSTSEAAKEHAREILEENDAI